MDWSKWKKLFSHISVEEIVPALLVLVVGLIVIKLLLKLLDTALRRSNLEKTAYTLLRSFLKILLLVVLVLILCSMMGVNVTSLVALLSVVTLAISLSVQNLLTNVISGIILLGSKPFKVGDFVEIGTNSGTVQALGMLYTKIVTADYRVVSIPNSNITANEIVNQTAAASGGSVRPMTQLRSRSGRRCWRLRGRSPGRCLRRSPPFGSSSTATMPLNTACRSGPAQRTIGPPALQ